MELHLYGLYVSGGFKSFVPDMKLALGNLWQHYKSMIPRTWSDINKKTQARVKQVLAYEAQKGINLTDEELIKIGMTKADITALKNRKTQRDHVIKKQQEKTNKKSLPKAMNKKQRAIIIGGIVAIIIMFLFPPYALYYSGSKLNKGYHVNYFLEPSKASDKIGIDSYRSYAIDIGTLSIQYVTVIIIGSLLWILARNTKLKDNLKSDQEKTK